MRGPIVLLTDFGHRDPYVGVMKGVILGLAPQAQIVDLCHEVPPQDVRAGAFQLMSAVAYFPAGSVFAAVVDPGVGSTRRVLWARTSRHQFLAPDNGLLSWIDGEEGILEWREVRERRLFLPSVSQTFHGRDVFAPVAAHLLRGQDPRVLGPAVKDPRRLPFPRPRRETGVVRGEVLAVDRFGNAVTNLRPADVRRGKRVYFRGKSLGPPRAAYASVPPGESLALFGSAGLLELSVREGDFARRHRARRGDRVESRA